jgi:outer membrane protein assembly factor BamB
MARNWTSFRNGGNSARQQSISSVPTQWSPTRNIAWKTELPGYGQSSPVVWENRVFATTVRGPQRDECLVHACDLKTGRLAWSRSMPSNLKREMSYYVSRAAPTPVVDRNLLVVFFESGELAAFRHDGTPVWQRALVKEYGMLHNEFGIGQSLEANDDSVFVLVDDPGIAYLLAVDKKTGKNRWKIDREPRRSWTSPVLARHAGREMLIVSANGTVEAFDTRDGSRIWSVDRMTGNIMPSAWVDGDRIYVGATPAQARLAKPGGRTAAETNCCIQLDPRTAEPRILWEGNRATCDFASPLAHRGLVYYVTAAGILYAVDANTGKEVFSERIDSPCWASPLATGDHIYFFGKNGVTTVIAAGNPLRRVARNALWDPQDPPKTKEPFSTTPNNPANAGATRRGNDDALDPILYGYAAVNGNLVLRLGSHLFCLRP